MPATYEDRMLRVLEYIYDHPTGDLSLDALADVAAMSRFHWHRVFHGMTGETAAQAVRRVRLHRGACWLVQSDMSVAEVAKRLGYDNPQSFARLFRTAYGMTPSAFRSRGDLTAPLLNPEKGNSPMFPVKIEDLAPMRLAALPHKGPYEEVGKAFDQVSAIITSRDLWPQVQGMLGVYYDDPKATPAHDLRSHACVLVGAETEISTPLEEIALTGGSYAVLDYTGPYAGLLAAYEHLYGTWLPDSGHEPADHPPVEIYLNSPHDTAPNDLRTRVCMPLKVKVPA